MNSYIHEVFNQIRQNQNVFLLNGPSVAELENKIHKLENKKVLYWGFNNITGIENNILNKISKKVDIWFIDYFEEFEIQRQNIIDFLEREDSKLLITGMHNFNALKYFNFLPLKNNHKILLLETLINREGINSCSMAISFFINLNYLNLHNNTKKLYLFGMDGIDLTKEKNNNHAYKDLYKLKRDGEFCHYGKVMSRSKALYHDMMIFDSNDITNYKTKYKAFFENYQIINASQSSYYQSLPKITQDEAIDNILQNANDGVITTPLSNFTIDEQIKMHNNIIAFVGRMQNEINIVSLSHTLNNINNVLNAVQHTILNISNNKVFTKISITQKIKNSIFKRYKSIKKFIKR